MAAVLVRSESLFSRFTQLRELLAIVAELRELRDPFGSPEQFRKLLGVVVRIGLFLGFEAPQLERWRVILSDEQLIAAVSSVVRYFLSRRGAQ